MKDRGIMTNLILFDLDGTLTDPAEGITRSVQYALKKHGIYVPDNTALLPFIGPPLIDSFMRFYGFTRQEAVRAVHEYREYYTDRGIFENRVYPGVPEMLAGLRNAGHRLCVATSKPEVFARRITDHFGLTPFFDAVAGSRMDETRTAKSEVISHAPRQMGVGSVRSAVMVGDRSYDVAGAHEVGMSCIGVTYGYGSAQELSDAGADALADSPEALRQLLVGGVHF